MEHHVYFWLKEHAKDEATRAKFEKGIDALFQAPQIARKLWSVPAKTEIRPVTDNSWDYALQVGFDSLDDHNGYQIDPIHTVFVEEFKDLWAKVEVKDLA